MQKLPIYESKYFDGTDPPTPRLTTEASRLKVVHDPIFGDLNGQLALQIQSTDGAIITFAEDRRVKWRKGWARGWALVETDESNSMLTLWVKDDLK